MLSPNEPGEPGNWACAEKPVAAIVRDLEANGTQTRLLTPCCILFGISPAFALLVTPLVSPSRSYATPRESAAVLPPLGLYFFPPYWRRGS